MMRSRMRSLLAAGEFWIFTATLVAGLGWVASKEVIQVMPSASFVGYRYILAATVLVPLCWQDIRRLTRYVLLQALALGGLLGVAMLVWIYALGSSDSMGEGAFIMTTSILMAPLIGWSIFRQPLSYAFWVAAPIAAVGVACLSLTQGWQPEVAQLFFLGSALLLSLHFNLNKYLTGKINTLPLVCVQLFGAGVLSFVVACFRDDASAQMTGMTWLWFAVSVVISTSLRYVLQTIGQGRISTANAAIMMILEPIWVLLLSIAIYQEILPLQKLIGCLLIIAALLVYRGLSTRLR